MHKKPKKYSVFSLIKNSLTYHENWQPAWRSPEPKKEYDAVIVGGGGHGLATAYYLAKKHNLTNIAVVEKGWIGGGNTGRNTTIIRSNYLWDASAGLYDHALKIWEGLSQELNYNVMFSQRGVMNLAHNLQDVRDLKRRTHANRLNGIDADWLSTDEVKKFCKMKVNNELSSNKIIGIKEIRDYLQGKTTLIKAKELITQKTRQYAKRQFTWARGHMKSWEMIYSSNINDLFKKTINKIS